MSTVRMTAEPLEATGTPASRRTRAIVLVGLALFVLYSVAPVWWLIVNATKDSSDLLLSNGLWFADFNLGANLRQIVY